MTTNQSRGATPERIFEWLEADIINRVYPPGTHLVEKIIAANLGVSRTPVREAFRSLQRAGWIESHPHAGTYVRQPSLDEVREVFELRIGLEEMAVGLAVERITENELGRLNKLIESGHTAAYQGDTREVASLNYKFHSELAKASRNSLLRRTIDDLGKQVQWHYGAVASLRSDSSWNEHEKIVATIKAKEAREAQFLMTEHIQHTRKAFFDYLMS